jgi:hypothetical protein
MQVLGGLLDSHAVSDFGSFPSCLGRTSDPQELPGVSRLDCALLCLSNSKSTPAIKRDRHETGSWVVEPQVFLGAPCTAGLS